MKKFYVYSLVLLSFLGVAALFIYFGEEQPVFDQPHSDHDQPFVHPKNTDTQLIQRSNVLEDSQRLVFLLQYIGNDYAGAVRNGKIIDSFEYHEVRDFVKTAIQQYQASGLTQEETTEGLLTLEQMITDRVSSDKVLSACKELVKSITEERDILPIPVTPPNLAEGKILFNENCSQCHGLSGDGQTSLASDFNPKPSDLTDPTEMNSRTPYQIYQAITLGIPGTAMPSYDPGCNAQQRWNVAFYVMTLRRGFKPNPPKQNIKLTLAELSTSSNVELVQKLAQQNNCTVEAKLNELTSEVDYLRKHIPQLTKGEYLTVALKKMRQSFDAFHAGDSKSASQLALDAYLQGFQPIEQEITPESKIAFERALRNYQQCINDGAATKRANRFLQAAINALQKIRAKIADLPS